MAKQKRPEPPGSPLETRMERFQAAAAEIWEKQISMPLGIPLAAGFDILESYLGDFVKGFEEDEARLRRLEALLAAADALLKKLEGIDLDGLDPEKIRQKVLEALADWKTQVEADLRDLKKRTDDLAAADTRHENSLTALAEADTQHSNRLGALETTDLQHNGRLDALESTDAQHNSRLGTLEAALLALQGEDKKLGEALTDLLKRLGALETSDADQNKVIGELKKALDEVIRQLGGLDLTKLDPEKIKQAVLDALANWRTEVGNALLKLQTDLTNSLNRLLAAEKGLEDLRKKIEAVDWDALTPEKIRQQVLDALAAWQKKLEDAVQALNIRIAALEAGKQQTDAQLKEHGARISLAETTLLGHKSAIDQLRTDLTALAEEVKRIISNGGPDPEAIKKLVLEALKAWQEKIQSDLNALVGRADALDTLTGGHTSTLSTHTQQIAELKKQVEEILARDPADPATIVKQVLDLLADWRRQVEQRLGQLQAAQNADRERISGHDTKIADLFSQIERIFQKINGLEGEDRRLNDALLDLKTSLESQIKETREDLTELDTKLLAEIARLDARINSIETTGIDPEDVRQIIRDEFKAWQEAIEGRLRTVETVTKGLRFGYDTLIRRLVKLETNTLTADEVRRILTAELALWRDQTDKSISDLWAKIRSDTEALAKWQVEFDLRLDGDEAALADLKKKLEDLDRLLHDRTDHLPTAEEIKNAVLQVLQEWKISIEQGLGDHTQSIRNIHSELQRLERTIQDLARTIPDPEALKNAIIALLAEWQKRTDHDIDLLERRTTQSKKDIEDLRDDLTQLIQRVNEIVLTGGTPADVEKRIREALESLRRQLEKELNAVRDRNEQDRLALLQLRGTLDIVQERVRKLEIRDFLAEVLAALEERLKAIEALAKAAQENAATQQTRLDDLLKDDGTLEQMKHALELLKRQMANRPDRKAVQDMIDSALNGLQEWRTLTDGSIKRLDLGLKKTNDDLNDLREQTGTADRLIHKEFTQKTDDLGSRITDLDKRTDERLDTAEKRLNTDDTEDRIFKENADNRFKQLEGWQAVAKGQINKGIDKDTEHDRRLLELQQQIDNWKPDASGDMADRLARRCLTGRGVVMGFEIWHTAQYTLHIGPGLGITSDGHIIRFRKGEYFTHYREWADKEQYDFFKDAGEQVEVWELVPKSADETGCKALTPQRGSQLRDPFIQGKVVLVFIPPHGTPPGEEPQLTFVLVDQEDMARLLGSERLLKLLVAKHDDTDIVWGEDYSPLDEVAHEEDFYRALRPESGLMEIALPRFGLDPRDKCAVEDMDQTNFPKIAQFKDLFKAWNPSVQDALLRLDTQVRQAIRWYGRLLFPQYTAEYLEGNIEKMMSKWTDYMEYCQTYEQKATNPAKFPDLPAEQPHWFIQYYYDWARDLILGYHELRDELNTLMASSCLAEENDPKANHPHHLMLGIAMREEYTGLASPLRHEFVQPPIYNGNAARLETCRLYLRRWLLLVQGFYLPIDPDPVANPTCHRDEDNNFPNPLDYSALKITPGRSYFHPLSQQSLPFYYLVTLGTQSVHRFWNYRRAKTGTVNQLLCYHASDALDSYSKLPHVIRPLYYTLDAYDFYRVEGHLGQPEAVVNTLREMVRKYNLDFDIVPRSLTALSEEISAPTATEPGQYTFQPPILGAEHIAGVPKGGTLILVTDAGKVVADFSVPYRAVQE